MSTRPVWFVALAMACFTITASAQTAPQYAIVDSVRVGPLGPGLGKYYAVDPSGRRLYGVGRYVLDIDTKVVVDSFADTAVGGGFVLAPALSRGLVRSGLLFDLRTGRTIKDLGYNGEGTAYDASTGRAFLFSEISTAVDLKTGAVVGHPSVSGVGQSAVSDGRGHVYANISDSNVIAVIDTHSLRVVASYKVSVGRKPAALAIDAPHRRLFVGCDSLLVVLDADGGRVITTLPMNGWSDQNAFDPKSQLIFMPNGKAKGLTIVHEDTPDKYTIVQTVMDPRLTSSHVVIDDKTHRLFIPHRFADEVLGFEVLAPLGSSTSATISH
jgi:hypothetical protein